MNIVFFLFQNNIELIKTYLILGFTVLLSMIIRTGCVLSTDPFYAIKLIIIDGKMLNLDNNDIQKIMSFILQVSTFICIL